MKRTVLLAAFAAAFFLGACSSDSNLPTATGKGSIRALNAIKTSPEVAFKIEDRSIGTAEYRQVTNAARYDDLEYTFNFDVFYLGDLSLTRIASQFLDVTKDLDYIFVLTGSVSDASISIWETVDRGFDGSESVFEVRFANTSPSMGTANYYFAEPGVMPVLGQEIGTLSFGETLAATDFAAGDYVLTVTDSTDPSLVLFQSGETAFAGATQYIITTFDNDAKSNALANHVASAIPVGVNAIGVTTALADGRYPATVELVNGSISLGTVDIYDDEALTSKIVASQAYRNVSAELDLESGLNNFYYTPVDSTATVLLESSLNFADGLRGRAVAFGESGALTLNAYAPDRQSVETHAKLQLFNAAFSYEFIDIYVVPADETIAGSAPALSGISRGFTGTTIPLPNGSYDIYIAEFGGTDPVSAPVRIDVVRGDVVGGIIFDTIDTAVVDVVLIPDNL